MATHTTPSLARRRSGLLALTVALLASSGALAAQSEAGGEGLATYLANAGVVVARGDTKIAFDPLFKAHFDTYRLMPPEMEAKFLAGDAPFDGLDAIFVSHLHGDHIDPGLVAEILQRQPALELYAPAPAAAGVLKMAGSKAPEIEARVFGVDLEVGDAAYRKATDELVIEAVRIPHSGWPSRMTTVMNLAFRVTLEPHATDPTTVVHLGDAHAHDPHFETHADHWKQRALDLALPPYWFLASDGGAAVLERLAPGQVVGVHVPAEYEDPAKVPAGYEGDDLFVTPGETRVIEGAAPP